MNELEELRLHYGADITEWVEHPVLFKHRALLGKLVSDGVFCVFHSEEDGFTIQECCDDWFSHTLTKEECLELSEMFREIALSIG